MSCDDWSVVLNCELIDNLRLLSMAKTVVLIHIDRAGGKKKEKFIYLGLFGFH